MLTSETRPNRSILAAAVLAAALLVTLFAHVQGAEAAKVTACVKKKTGEMRLVTGKKAKRKCPKGWHKVTWNKRGPSRPPLQVRDSKGRLVGKFLGVVPAGVPIYVVQRVGGQYIYFGSGLLYSLGSPDFTTSDCSGTAYMKSDSAPGSLQQVLKLFAGPFRIVYRTVSAGVYGPAKAWKSSPTHEPQDSLLLHSWSLNGVCQVDGAPFTGELIALKRVKAPPDFVGPLKVK